MKIINPEVEMWSELDVSPEQHIARCARVCYGHDGEGKDPKALVAGLIKNGHTSMLRHASRYFEFPSWCDSTAFECNKFWTYVKTKGGLKYISGSLQTYNEESKDYLDDKFKSFTPEEFLKTCSIYPEVFDLFRFTFCITTQISTSRELNRKSPNNIAEQSTRYCSSKDGITICKPHWFKEEHNQVVAFEPAYPEQEAVLAWTDAEEHYKNLLEMGLKPEDARTALPLDTATKVVYTYSVREWRDIINLRYYGTTGKPHPNAKLVIGMVRDQINHFAEEHEIRVKL